MEYCFSLSTNLGMYCLGVPVRVTVESAVTPVTLTSVPLTAAVPLDAEAPKFSSQSALYVTVSLFSQ